MFDNKLCDRNFKMHKTVILSNLKSKMFSNNYRVLNERIDV